MYKHQIREKIIITVIPRYSWGVASRTHMDIKFMDAQVLYIKWNNTVTSFPYLGVLLGICLDFQSTVG